MNPTFYSENDFRLYHHGILGMKWGVRRYQNKDGSLTLDGKRHYYGKKQYKPVSYDDCIKICKKNEKARQTKRSKVCEWQLNLKKISKNLESYISQPTMI